MIIKQEHFDSEFSRFLKSKTNCVHIKTKKLKKYPIVINNLKNAILF